MQVESRGHRYHAMLYDFLTFLKTFALKVVIANQELSKLLLSITTWSSWEDHIRQLDRMAMCQIGIPVSRLPQEKEEGSLTCQAHAAFSIDLNNRFPVESQLTSAFVQNSTISMGQSTAAFFNTNDSLLVYQSATNTTQTLSSLDLSNPRWTSVPLIGNGLSFQPEFQPLCLTDPVSGLGYYLEDNNKYSNLLRLNLSDPEKPSSTNESVRISPGDDKVPSISGAAMQYLPVGKAGILILIGGWNVSYMCVRGYGIC